jgi:hypothetical protein
MSRMKVMLLSLLAVFAFAAIASASASAALLWYQCSEHSGSGPKYTSQANCESLTSPGSGTWEWLPLLATAAAPLLVPTEGVGKQKLSVSTGAFIIECSKLKDSADAWNDTVNGVGRDLLLEAVYTGCEVTKPSGCKDVHSTNEEPGTIRLALDIPSKLLTKEGVTYDQQEQNASGEFVTIVAETEKGSEKPCGVAKLTNKVKGSAIGKIGKMSKLIEFEGKSGEKPLEMNTLPAEYSGNDEQKAEAGMVNIFAE